MQTTTRLQTTKRLTTTTSLPVTRNYEQFSEEFDEEVGGVLPALTSVNPKKTFRPSSESTTKAVKTIQQNQLEFEQKAERRPTSFDEILEQQYKIKGLDISSEETYEDEKLIGVLGSQV